MQDEWNSVILDRIDKVSPWVNSQIMRKLVQARNLETDYQSKLELGNHIESILSIHESKFLDFERPVLAPPPSGKLRGELNLGTIVVGDAEVGEFRLPLNALSRGLGIYAQSGHSKTTVLRNLAHVLVENDVNFIWLDFKKEARYLIPTFPDLIVLPWNKVAWNPYRNPPGMDLRDWGKILCDILGHSWKVYVAGVNYVWQLSCCLYDEYDKTGRMPTFKDLRELMLRTSESTRKGMDYWETIWNKVDTTVSMFGDLLVAGQGLPIESLLSKRVVLELNGLRSDIAAWMAECFLVFFFQYHLANDIRSERLRYVIISDEASRLWYPMEYQDVSTEMGLPRLFDIPIMARDMGLGLVTATQMPSMISKVVAANQLVKLVGNLSSGTEIWAMKESLGLNDEETEYIHRLRRAEWICRVSDYYTEPTMLVTPDFPVDRNVTEAMVLDRLRLLPMSQEKTDRPLVSQRTALPRISEDGKALLLDVNNHPFRGISKRYTILGFSGRRGELARVELVQKNLVGEAEVQISQYRPTKFLVLTETALRLLATMHQSTQFWNYLGHVSFEHRLQQVFIHYGLREAGYQSRTEYDIGDGRRLDVYATNQGRRIGVEVSLNTNIDYRKLLASLKLLDRLFIVCKDKRIVSEIEAWLDRIVYPHLRDRIKVLVFNQFLKTLKAGAYV